MIYLSTPSILAAIAGIISLFVGINFLLSYKKTGTPGIRDLALVFLFLAGHAFTLAVISIFFLDKVIVLAYGYNIAIFFIYLTLMAGVGITVFRSHYLFRTHLRKVRLSLLVLGLLVFIIQYIYLGFPEVNNSQVINWHDNFWAGIITGVTSFLYGLAWGWLFWRDSNLLSNKTLRLKMRFLSLIGILLGIAGLISFTNLKDFLPSNSAISLFIIAALLAAVIATLPKTTPSLEGSQGEKKPENSDYFSS